MKLKISEMATVMDVYDYDGDECFYEHGQEEDQAIEYDDEFVPEKPKTSGSRKTDGTSKSSSITGKLVNSKKTFKCRNQVHN